MPLGVVPGAVGEIRRASSAGGTSLTAGTPVFFEFPDGTRYYSLDAIALAGGAGLIKVNKCPYLHILKTTDSLAAAANASDQSGVAQDALTTTGVNINALAATGFLYVGSSVPFRGVSITKGTANALASVLTVKYWNGSAWVDITATDGTALAGATFGQSGNVTWTIPAAWTATSLDAMENPGVLVPLVSMKGLYWTRWQVSALLSATVNNTKMQGMNRDTNYVEILAAVGGVPEWSEETFKGFGGFSGLEVDVDAGTAKVVCNVASLSGYGFANN